MRTPALLALLCVSIHAVACGGSPSSDAGAAGAATNPGGAAAPDDAPPEGATAGRPGEAPGSVGDDAPVSGAAAGGAHATFGAVPARVRAIHRGKREYPGTGWQRCYVYAIPGVDVRSDPCFTQHGFTYEGLAGYLFEDNVVGTSAIRRCIIDPLLTLGQAPGDGIQFLSMDAGGSRCDDMAVVHDDVLGYAFPVTPENLVRVGVAGMSRMWNLSRDFVSTTRNYEMVSMSPSYVGNARGQNGLYMALVPADDSYRYYP